METPWIDNPDRPRVHPIETGRVRFRKILGAAWTPAMVGIVCLVIMIASALYGQWKSLYGIPLWVAWHGYCVLMWRRDPQYWEIILDCEWHYPWGDYLAPAEEVGAKPVPVQASVATRARAGSYDD